MSPLSVLPTSRSRITDLVVWDCALVFVVVGLAVANTLLVPDAPPPSDVAKSSDAEDTRETPTEAETPDAEQPPEAETPKKGRRRRARRRRRSGGDASTANASPLVALKKEALATTDGSETLRVLARADAHSDDPDYLEFRTALFAHLSQLDAAPALLPQAQHLADVRDVDRLQQLLSSLPASADRSALEGELTLARRAAPTSGRVKTFRPGWKERPGLRGTLASDLDDERARAVLDGVEAVVELASSLCGSDVPKPTLTVEVDAAAALTQPATFRRAKEPTATLVDRARWATAAHLVAGWKLAEPLASGVTAYLAGCEDARGSLSVCGARWERLLHARDLRGDGEAVLRVLSGEGDWLLAWGWVRFAALDGSVSAISAREDLHSSLTQGTPLTPWDPGRAAEAELSWLKFSRTP